MNFGGTAHTPQQSAAFDAVKFVDKAIEAVFSVQREKSADGAVVYYDRRLAEDEVNSPGPEISIIPSEASLDEFVAVRKAVYREFVFDVMRKEPALKDFVPAAKDLMPAWIVNESGDDVRIVLGRGDDGEPYRVDRDARTVLRVHDDGLVSGEFDLHDMPFSQKKDFDFGM